MAGLPDSGSGDSLCSDQGQLMFVQNGQLMTLTLGGY